MTGKSSVTCWLTDAAWGDRAGGAISAIERSPKNTNVAWAATTTGRLFISTNVDAEPASAVEWTRIDDDAVTPNRFVSSIYPHPALEPPRVRLVQRVRLQHAGHAWDTCSG